MFRGTLRAVLCTLHPYEKARLNSLEENTTSSNSSYLWYKEWDFSLLTGILMVLLSFIRKEQPPEHELHGEASQTLTH